MLIELHPENPQKRLINQIVESLKKGGVLVLPTDTVYAFACLLGEKKSIEKIYQLKEISSKKPLSLYCRDFSQAAEYVRLDNNQIFRWMKKNLPGPYTLIFQASKKLPHYTLNRQQTVGIRIVDNPVIQALLEQLDQPIIGSSVFIKDKYLTYATELHDMFSKQVTAVIDAGPMTEELSTILDCQRFPPEVIRQGKGVY